MLYRLSYVRALAIVTGPLAALVPPGGGIETRPAGHNHPA
jgi:hypothetical protein